MHVYSALSLYYYYLFSSLRWCGTHLNTDHHNLYADTNWVAAPFAALLPFNRYRCALHENKFKKMTFVFDNVNYTLREAIIYTISFSPYLASRAAPSLSCSRLSVCVHFRGKWIVLRDSRCETRWRRGSGEKKTRRRFEWCQTLLDTQTETISTVFLFVSRSMLDTARSFIMLRKNPNDIFYNIFA